VNSQQQAAQAIAELVARRWGCEGLLWAPSPTSSSTYQPAKHDHETEDDDEQLAGGDFPFR
jgi:hypothetical protein